MSLLKLNHYSYDVAMDTLDLVCGHKCKMKRSPFVDIQILRKISPSFTLINASIDGIEYWVRMSIRWHTLVYQVDHASMVYIWNCEKIAKIMK